MIRRKHLTILALALFSVLLGSVAISSFIVQANPTNLKETLRIVLFEYEQVPVRVAYTWHPANFTFAFNPKQTFVNVTDMQVDVIVEPDYGVSEHKFDIKFNDIVPISSGSFDTLQYQLISLVIHIKNPSVYQYIEPGINTIAITNPHYYDGSWHSWFIDLYRVVLTIEYEYQTEGVGGVGGFWIPVDKFSLVAPYLAIVSTIILVVSISVAYIKYRKKQ